MKEQKSKIRRFSTVFKKEKVELLDQSKITVKLICDTYEVTPAAVYKWKRKYSKLPKTERIVVERISEQEKTKELLKEKAELERALGRKELELDYWKTVVSQANELYNTDIEKKLNGK